MSLYAFVVPEVDDEVPGNLLLEPTVWLAVRNLMAETGIRTFHPALVRDIASLAAQYLVNSVGQPGWKGVDPDDMIAVADYLTEGPSGRIPNDETAMAMIMSIVELHMTKPDLTRTINPTIEGKA